MCKIEERTEEERHEKKMMKRPKLPELNGTKLR
jgi:hypothetical protein